MESAAPAAAGRQGAVLPRGRLPQAPQGESETNPESTCRKYKAATRKLTSGCSARATSDLSGSVQKRADHSLMLTHRLDAVHAGLSSESTVHRHAKVGKISGGSLVPARQAADAVDRQHDAEVHTGLLNLEIGERTEKRVVLTP